MVMPCYFHRCLEPVNTLITEWCSYQEKVLRFWDKSVWRFCRIFCILRQEYLSSAVSVLANSLKFLIRAKQSFSNSIYLKFVGKRIIVVPCYFQRCLEPVNTLITQWCSEARPSRRFSQNLYSETIISEINRLGHSSFYQNLVNFMHISEMQ